MTAASTPGGADAGTRPAFTPGGPDAAPAPAAPSAPAFRETWGRRLLLVAALVQGLVAVFHGFGFVSASIAVGSSGLSPYYRDAFKALWLGFLLQSVVVAGMLLLGGLRPKAIGREAILLASLMPFASGILWAAYVSSGTAAVLLSVSALLALLGAFLRRS